MSALFSSGDNHIKRQQMKTEECKRLKASNDGSEVESPKNEMLDEGKDEPQQSENTVKSLKTETEHDNKTNVKKLKDLKQKQGTSRKDQDDCKSPIGNKFGIESNGNRTEDNALKKLLELPNRKVNLKSDVNNEEELNDCCQRKRKRCETECINYDQKFHESGLTCIGILPGLGGNIESSDDSDQSCSSGSDGNENVKYDLLGRSIVFQTKCSTESG